MIRTGVTTMTTKKQQHSAAFKEQALLKARQRGSKTLAAVAQELNLSLATLKGWLQRSDLTQVPILSGPAASFSPAQRLQALLESYPLSGEDLSAWCRHQGLFEVQLTQWRDAFCASPVPAPAVNSPTAGPSAPRKSAASPPTPLVVNDPQLAIHRCSSPQLRHP
jgi:hypothetical protein